MSKCAIAVIGVIVSTIPDRSMVVMGCIESPLFLHIGQFYDDYHVVDIRRKYVEFSHDKKLVRLLVGDEYLEKDLLPEVEVQFTPTSSSILITEKFRDEALSGTAIARALMQAGVEPIYIGGQVEGWAIFAIEPGSIYDVFGLKDYDVIMRINGFSLGSPSDAIKTLMYLKSESSWTLDIMRDGKDHTVVVRTSN